MKTQDRGIDLLAYDPAGRVVLVGEVKSKVGTSETWAKSFRRNMLAHGTIPKAAFFLIATPERLYFWKQNEPNLMDVPPEFTVDVTKEFKPYFDKLHEKPQVLGEQALEILVSSWLTKMASEGSEHMKGNSPMKWLADSGLLKLLEQARFEMNPA